MQFTDEDLDAAVAAGAIGAADAAGFRVFVERRRATPAADEESFRLLTGFSDIFVAIALGLVLVALSRLGEQFLGRAAGLLVAAASWALAEFFTRRRRMALPSILLLASFVFSAVTAADALLPLIPLSPDEVVKSLSRGAIGALAAFAHWRRFKVPVTVAAGAVTVGVAAVAAVAAHWRSDTVTLAAVLFAGLVVFALALAWDASDPKRKTRRADVAFWLHLIAAPAIVHPVFALLGLTGAAWFFPAALMTQTAPPPDPQMLLSAGVSLAIYAALALVALVIDRRALMVSGLAYLIYAASVTLRASGAPTASFALSALLVGAALLLLSAFWASARHGALRLIPLAWRERLPPAA